MLVCIIYSIKHAHGFHDDVMKWKHFSRYWPYVRAIHRWPVDPPPPPPPPQKKKKSSDAELWYFLWSAPEETVEQSLETPVNWDAIALIMTTLWCCCAVSLWLRHGVIIIRCVRFILNSLWHSDAISRYRSGSTLAKLMACCLTPPSLNRCWFIINGVLWHSPKTNFTGVLKI